MALQCCVSFCCTTAWSVMCLWPICSVMLNSLRPHRLQPASLLCQWDFSGKNTGVGCHFLLQRIFPTQGSNLCLLQVSCIGRWIIYHWAIRAYIPSLLSLPPTQPSRSAHSTELSSLCSFPLVIYFTHRVYLSMLLSQFTPVSFSRNPRPVSTNLFSTSAPLFLPSK